MNNKEIKDGFRSWVELGELFLKKSKEIDKYLSGLDGDSLLKLGEEDEEIKDLVSRADIVGTKLGIPK